MSDVSHGDDINPEIILSPEDFDAFLELLDGPPKVLPGLEALMRRSSPFADHVTDDVPSEGLWLVKTESDSTYLLDLDLSTCTRYPSEAASRLRLDGDEAPVIELLRLTVGEPMEVFLAIRDDGVPTYRRTTPVVSIERVGD